MSPENFDELLRLVYFDIQKQDTVLHEAIPASIMLAATVRFLSTGGYYLLVIHVAAEGRGDIPEAFFFLP